MDNGPEKIGKYIFLIGFGYIHFKGRVSILYRLMLQKPHESTYK
jgi:hypothetical protein